MRSIDDCPEKTTDGEVADLHVLDPYWTRIGPRARRVLLLVAERLAMGAEQYQDDLSPGRDWRREALEEVADGLTYIARAMIDSLHPAGPSVATRSATGPRHDRLTSRLRQVPRAGTYCE